MEDNIALIIACEAFRGELEYFKDLIKVDILWIEHSLHNMPAKLNLRIKETIHEAEQMLQPGATVLLFFGICGGALEGIQSDTLNLVYPDVHDCIPIILGSVQKFNQLHAEAPGTFYLNKAWIDSGEDPIGCAEKYTKIYGEKKGWRATKLMFDNYTRFTLIDNGCYELDPYRKHVKKACELFEKAYSEEKGNLEYVQAILNNRCELKKIRAKSDR